MLRICGDDDAEVAGVSTVNSLKRVDISTVNPMGKVFLKIKKRDILLHLNSQGKAAQREKLRVQVESTAWCLADELHSTLACYYRVCLGQWFVVCQLLHAKCQTRNKHIRKGFCLENLYWLSHQVEYTRYYEYFIPALWYHSDCGMERSIPSFEPT